MLKKKDFDVYDEDLDEEDSEEFFVPPGQYASKSTEVTPPKPELARLLNIDLKK
jgi:hypothetical protein